MPPKKKVSGLIKLQIQAGQATPAPPVGPALGQHGVNIMEFCKQYNAATEAQRGNVIPVEITVYEDRTFTFVTKTPPAARLILKAAGVDKGSGEPHKTKVGRLTFDIGYPSFSFVKIQAALVATSFTSARRNQIVSVCGHLLRLLMSF